MSSEILIIADKTSNPEWIASDLIGQAEHDPLAQCILISKDQKILEQTKKEIFFYAKRPKDFDTLIKNLKKASI